MCTDEKIPFILHEPGFDLKMYSKELKSLGNYKNIDKDIKDGKIKSIPRTLRGSLIRRNTLLRKNTLCCKEYHKRIATLRVYTTMHVLWPLAFYGLP